jgi:LPS export ABC transporter protein LptC
MDSMPLVRAMLSSAPWRARLAACVALALGLACSSGTPGTEAPAFSAEAQSLVVRLQNVGFQRFVGEQLEFEVLATRGTFQPERNLAELDNVQTYFRDEKGGPVRLRAEHGEFDLEKRNFVMRGAVEGTTPGGEHFSTSEAHYDRTKSLIVVDAPVTLQSGRVSSRGSGLQLDLASRELRLFDIEGRREAVQ